MTDSNYSLSDIAAVSGRNNDGMFGGGDWGAWIILFLLFGLFGRGGFGGFGGDGVAPCATQADVRAAVDQQTLISKIDQQTYGMADSFTALNNTLNSNFRGIDNAICTLGYQNQQGFNAIAHQLSDCCCTTQRAIDGVNYNMAKNTCDLQNTIHNTTRDIIDNQNCNTRSILDFLVSDKIANLQAENQALKLQASQAAQNAYLVNELRPCPIPAYITCNPYAASYGLTNGCGCGCA
jgi:hypothetical protein